MSVSIKFCGAAQTVTGSMHLLQAGHTQVLIDCGLYHGPRDEYYSVNSHFPFNPQALHGCVLSHAHIDHSGNIPTLIKQGYRGSIYTTPVTRDFCRYMLPDSGYIQEEDIKYVNKINKKRGRPSRLPLYTQDDAEKSLKYFRAVDYNHPFQITKDISLMFFEAGHILGSATPVFDMSYENKNIRVGYAVDLGRMHMPLLRDPEVPDDLDYLILESTYGARAHESIQDAEVKLAAIINRTIERKGKIIIPSFALERTQLIVYFISELMKRNMIPEIPIYIDSPLAVNLTSVFREHSEYFDEITRKAFRDNNDPLGYDNITYIKNVNESKKLNLIDPPGIIISASGMCENGRILHHLKNNIENPNNTIIVIGFMAQQTLGRRIVEHNELVRIYGRLHELKCEVAVINAFSSHADHDGLMDYVKTCQRRSKKLKKIFIVHGELSQSLHLEECIKKELKIKACVPEKGEIRELI